MYHNIGDVYFISPPTPRCGCSAGGNAKYLDEPSVTSPIHEWSPKRSKAASHTVQSRSCHPQLCLLPHLLFFISIFSWYDQKEKGICSFQWVFQSCGKHQWWHRFPLVLSTLAHCTHCHVCSGSACSKPLFNNTMINGKVYVIPRFKYEAQDLKEWLGWLLSRPAIDEEVFKAFWKPHKDCMEDMWDGKHLCRILLKKGKRFLPGPVDEMHLAFSFSMDSFNPYHMKEAKQTVLSTAIWLTLLNLPLHLWNRPKNMFLAGVLPRPRKPSLSNVNHTIKLLVDVLLEFFDPGIWYSQMVRHKQGCRVQAILVPVISDMLAARQAGGFASLMATSFCMLCNLKIQDIENLDRSTWPEWDVGEHLQLARKWRDIQMVDEQETVTSR